MRQFTQQPRANFSAPSLRSAKITFFKIMFWLVRRERKDHIRAELLIINIDYLLLMTPLTALLFILRVSLLFHMWCAFPLPFSNIFLFFMLCYPFL